MPLSIKELKSNAYHKINEASYVRIVPPLRLFGETWERASACEQSGSFMESWLSF